MSGAGCPEPAAAGLAWPPDAGSAGCSPSEALPCPRVRRGVLSLLLLRSWSPLLQRSLPREVSPPATARGQPAASAESGRPARPSGPPAGVPTPSGNPGAAADPPPGSPREGSRFPAGGRLCQYPAACEPAARGAGSGSTTVVLRPRSAAAAVLLALWPAGFVGQSLSPGERPMISAEIKAQIRHLFHAEHWKMGTIASQLDVHTDTVRRALETERFHRGPSRRNRLTDPYLEFIHQTLEQYPRLRATRLYQMLQWQRRSLSSPLAGAGRALSLRHPPLRPRPRQREGPRRALRSVCPLQLFCRPSLHHPARLQPPGARMVPASRSAAPLARRPQPHGGPGLPAGKAVALPWLPMAATTNGWAPAWESAWQAPRAASAMRSMPRLPQVTATRAPRSSPAASSGASAARTAAATSLIAGAPARTFLT